MGGTTLYAPSDPVVAQYDRWQYPAPVDDLRNPAVAQYLKSYSTLEVLTPFYWPTGAPSQNMDVLVAGCGTMAAAAYALINPRCKVTGIDISSSALAHEEKLKRHHQLDNLTLHQCPIEEVASLGQTFDFIGCQGVLHHMPDPNAGLKALAGVIRRNGVIALMLYAKYGRVGVYMLQDLFRIMRLEQTPEHVALVRQMINMLPGEHPARTYIRHATDLKADAGLVDTFLHPRDRCYCVKDCLEMVKDAGLVFQDWDQRYPYYPDGPYHASPGLLNHISQLSDEEQWQAMELSYVPLGVHYFHVCRADRDTATYRAPWNSEKLLECIPMVCAKLIKAPMHNGSSAWAMIQQGVPPLPMTEQHAAVVSHIDGQNKTVRHCMEAAGVRGDCAAQAKIAREIFRRLWRCGFAALRWSHEEQSSDGKH